jgi:hypothetical protein
MPIFHRAFLSVCLAQVVFVSAVLPGVLLVAAFVSLPWLAIGAHALPMGAR